MHIYLLDIGNLNQPTNKTKPKWLLAVIMVRAPADHTTFRCDNALWFHGGHGSDGITWHVSSPLLQL